MAAILELDLGNSFIKWRVLESGHCREGGRFSELSELEARLDADVSLVRIASVARADREAGLAALLDARALNYRFAKPQKNFAGVESAYSAPEKMGVDRWLAMLAAYGEVRGRCIVVDAGSALTIDVLEADGRHVGGYIIPGARMMASALHGGTGKVRFEGDELIGTAPGVSTEECVHHGKWLALLGSVNFVVDQYKEQWPEGFEVFVTGGDGPVLANLLSERARDWRLRDDLVMDGLAIALPLTDGE